MKTIHLLIGDIKFQYRYGFYFLYSFFTILYIFILGLLPYSLRQNIGLLLIFSDPSIIGLIFAGAIVHFELSERTFDSLCIAPIKPSQYLVSKLVSIALISLLTSILIGLTIGIINNLLSFISAVIVGSMFFSMVGFTLAFMTNSLNRFFFSLMPIIVIVVIPGAIQQFIDLPTIMIFHPGVALIEMLNNGSNVHMAFLSMGFWIISAYLITNRVLHNKMKSQRG